MDNFTYLLRKDNLETRMHLVKIAVQLDTLKKNVENMRQSIFDRLTKCEHINDVPMTEQEPPLDTTQPPLTLVPKKKAGRPPGVKNKPKTISPPV